jgi:hypothetical protein
VLRNSERSGERGIAASGREANSEEYFHFRKFFDIVVAENKKKSDKV